MYSFEHLHIMADSRVTHAHRACANSYSQLNSGSLQGIPAASLHGEESQHSMFPCDYLKKGGVDITNFLPVAPSSPGA